MNLNIEVSQGNSLALKLFNFYLYIDLQNNPMRKKKIEDNAL